MSIIDVLGDVIIQSLNNERYWKSERAFQSEFYCNLKRCNEYLRIFPDAATLETEYPKKLELHGLRYRPDLIVHIPFESGMAQNRGEGNFLIIEFKVQSTLRRAISDFYKLNKIIEELRYPEGFFINVNSEGKTFLQSYRGGNQDKIHEISVFKVDGRIKIKHAYFKDREVLVDEIL